MNEIEKLHIRWRSETITLPEIKKYAKAHLELYDKYERFLLLIDDVYDEETLRHIILAPKKSLLQVYAEEMTNWFSALLMALKAEEYELCADIKKITEIEESMMITAVFKFRRELFSDEFIEQITLINRINNKAITR